MKSLKSYPLHTYIGWAGAMIALVEYFLFAAGYLPAVWFFGIGMFASILLSFAYFKDKAYYGFTLQLAFILFNVIGVVANLKN